MSSPRVLPSCQGFLTGIVPRAYDNEQDTASVAPRLLSLASLAAARPVIAWTGE
jgi:hypothetical protein